MTYAQSHQQIEEINRLIQTASLAEIVHTIEANHWKPPLITSRHVEQIAAETERPALFAARSFGASLLARFDAWRTDLVAASSPCDAQPLVDHLLWLADWLMETPGYGNLFLAARCHDFATIGLGKLAINLDYPLSEITPRLQRLHAHWYAPSIRRAILNQEAGAALFADDERDEEAIQRLLEQTWQCGMFAADRDREKRSGRRRIMDTEWKVLDALISGILFRGPKIPKAYFAFFEDGSFSPEFTVNDLWERKWHEKCVIGFELPNTRELMALATFRETVGFFPTTIPRTIERQQELEREIQQARENGITIVPYEEAYRSMGETAS